VAILRGADNASQVFNDKIESPLALAELAGKVPNPMLQAAEVTLHNNALLNVRTGGKRRSVVAGGMIYRGFIVTTAFRKDADGIMLRMDAHNPVGQKKVMPGETYISEDRLYPNVSTGNPFDALKHYTNQLARVNLVNLNYYNFFDFVWLDNIKQQTGPWGEIISDDATNYICKIRFELDQSVCIGWTLQFDTNWKQQQIRKALLRE